MPTPEERRRWERLVEGLKEAETDEVPTPEDRRGTIAWLNEVRAKAGIPPLREDNPSKTT